jgi:hypothetical protein
MVNPEPGPGFASAGKDFSESDLERLMSEAREAQAESPVEDAPVKPPNVLAWAGVAISLVLISVAIHFFWPAP